MFRHWMIVLTLVVLLGAMFAGCSPDAGDDPGSGDDSVVLEVFVENDDLFGYERDDRVARVFLTDSKGLVGTPIEATITMDDIDVFDENEIEVFMQLENPNAIKLDDFYIYHSFSDRQSTFKFVIPQVWTVPTLLDFQMYLRIGDPTSEEYFEAATYFQFYVNQGTPAT